MLLVTISAIANIECAAGQRREKAGIEDSKIRKPRLVENVGVFNATVYVDAFGAVEDGIYFFNRESAVKPKALVTCDACSEVIGKNVF